MVDLSQIDKVISIGDIHGGCQLALLPPGGIFLDGGTWVGPSEFQAELARYWDDFCNNWVPHVTEGRPFVLELGGDLVDGNHHNAVSQITHNIKDQRRIAYEVLKPLADKAAAVVAIRGTGAHAGPNGIDDDAVAQSLGAIPDEHGHYARWKYVHTMMGKDGHPRRIHFTHHLGTGRTMAPLDKEQGTMYEQAGRWGKNVKDVIVRHHVHEYKQIQKAGRRGLQIVVTAPGWQGKGEFGHKIDTRMVVPQFGGLCISVGDEGLFVRAKVYVPEDDDA